ncbi:MAG TPA: hypothetical protein VI306_00645 [Pyrinomonadaceae bacterium]
MNEREQRDQKVRRIVVTDEAPSLKPEIRGRKLESPPAQVPTVNKPKNQTKSPPVRREFLFAGLGAVLVLTVLVVAVGLRRNSNVLKANKVVVAATPEPVVIPTTPAQSPAIQRNEEDAKQVVRRISRDNKPYSFSENALEEIESRATALSQASSLSNSIASLHEKAATLGSQASKAGLQPTLVILVGLALSKGGEQADVVNTALRALPQLASLNKTFGSSEAESCLILIAALPEGVGTARSHPLLRRINKVVNNPLTERNIWYLHDQKVVSDEAYQLVVDTIAYGVIAANPQRFGLTNDPLSF